MRIAGGRMRNASSSFLGKFEFCAMDARQRLLDAARALDRNTARLSALAGGCAPVLESDEHAAAERRIGRRLHVPVRGRHRRHHGEAREHESHGIQRIGGHEGAHSGGDGEQPRSDDHHADARALAARLGRAIIGYLPSWVFCVESLNDCIRYSALYNAQSIVCWMENFNFYAGLSMTKSQVHSI